MTLTLYYIYLVILGIASIISIIQIKKMATSFRLLSSLICVSFATELVAYWAAVKYGNNYVVYNIYSYIEFALICLYFNYSIDIFKKHHIGIFIAICGTLWNLANTVFLQPLDKPNFNFMAVETLAIIYMSMNAIYIHFKNGSRFGNNLHFTIASLFVLNWMISFLHWGMGTHIANLFTEKGVSLQAVILAINIIIYVVFSATFVTYPKFNRTE